MYETSESMLRAMAVAVAVLTVTVVVGIFSPSRIVVALVRLAFVLAFVVTLVALVWGLSTMTFLYFSGGSK